MLECKVGLFSPLMENLMREAGSAEDWILNEKMMPHMTNIRSEWVSAFEDGHVVGNLRLFSLDGVGMISHVYTRFEHRHKGVATLMVKFAKEHFSQLEKSFLLTATVKPDGHSHRAFQKNGFEVLTPLIGGEVMVGWHP